MAGQIKKRIYIAGAGGMLGEAFKENFNKDYILKCTDIDLNDEWISYLDFRDYNSYSKDVLGFNPDWLFHIGANTNLEDCELNKNNTYRTNTDAVKHAVSIANALSIPLLYISTAGIYDGNKAIYNELDKPNPIGHYAKSKYMGEKYVIENCKYYIVSRAGWMMGGGPKKDKKFIQNVLKQIKEGKKELYIVNDKLGTPTYTHDFAQNIKLLIENQQYGLFNMVCEGLSSRLEQAHAILDIMKLNHDIKIIEVDSDYFSKTLFAKRPNCELLINQRLNDLNLNIMRDWKVALREYLNNYYSNYL